MANERVLIIEDARDLSEIIANYLRKEGYSVRSAYDGEEGVRAAREFAPELILLDIMLPKVDGTEVCRQIRGFTNAPIMAISAKSEDIDKLLMLGLGADDYVTKPFSLVELGARVRSHIRRFTTLGAAATANASGGNAGGSACSADETRVCGEIEINASRHSVTVCGKPVELTAREFKLLEFFSQHPSQVFSKEQLIDSVWGYNEFIDRNTITVYVGRLREKLSACGACYIKTVWGVGYKWEQ